MSPSFNCQAVEFEQLRQTLAAAVYNGRQAHVCDMETGKQRVTLRRHTEPINSIAFSPDGKTVATASKDATVKLWDPTTGQERLTFEGSSSMTAVAFSPDGSTLVAASHDGTVMIWRAATGEQR